VPEIAWSGICMIVMHGDASESHLIDQSLLAAASANKKAPGQMWPDERARHVTLR
jgi:hypothetical protein